MNNYWAVILLLSSYCWLLNLPSAGGSGKWADPVGGIIDFVQNIRRVMIKMMPKLEYAQIKRGGADEIKNFKEEAEELTKSKIQS